MSSEVVEQATRAIFAQYSSLPRNSDEQVMHYSDYAKLVEAMPGFLTDEFTLEAALSVFADNADPNRMLDEASIAIRYSQFHGLLLDMAASRFPTEDRDIAFCTLMAMHLTRLPKLELKPVGHRKRRTSISAPVLPSVVPGEALLRAVEQGGALPRSSSFAQQQAGDKHHFFGGPYSSAIPNYGRRSSLSPLEGSLSPLAAGGMAMGADGTTGTASHRRNSSSGGSSVVFRPGGSSTILPAHTHGLAGGPSSPDRSGSPFTGQRPVYSPRPLGASSSSRSTSPTHAHAMPPEALAEHDYSCVGRNLLNMSLQSESGQEGGLPRPRPRPTPVSPMEPTQGQEQTDSAYEPVIMPDRVLEVARAHRLLTVLDRIATRQSAGVDMKTQMRLMHVGWGALRQHAQQIREQKRLQEEMQRQRKQAELELKRAQEEAEEKRAQAEVEQKRAEAQQKKKQEEEAEKERKKAQQQAEEQKRQLAKAEEERKRLQERAEADAARMAAQLEAEREQRAALAAQLAMEEQRRAQAEAEQRKAEEEMKLRAEHADIHAKAIAALEADRKQKEEALLRASRQAKGASSLCSLTSLFALLVLLLTTFGLGLLYVLHAINVAHAESGTCDALAAWHDGLLAKGVPLPPVSLHGEDEEGQGGSPAASKPIVDIRVDTGCLHILQWQSPLCIQPAACVQSVLLPQEVECGELYGCGQDHLAV